jgi:hypothetical protein
MLSPDEMEERSDALIERVSPILDADGNPMVLGHVLAQLVATYILSAPDPIRGEVMAATFQMVIDLVNAGQAAEASRVSNRLH